MTFRNLLLATASLGTFLCSAPPAWSAPMTIDQAAAMFSTRPTGYAPDLSPSGDKIVYLMAGPGSTTVARIRDLKTDTDTVLTRSSGRPEQLYYCAFADDRWVVCKFGGQKRDAGMLYPVARTFALDTKTGATRRLSASAPGNDDAFLQFDGRIIDWLPDESGSVLMQRNTPVVAGGSPSVSVDKIHLDPFKVDVVEAGLGRDVEYLTDGHGQVRVKSEDVTDLNNFYTGRAKYQYRTAGSEKWLPLPETDPDFQPLVVDRRLNALYYLKPLSGRAALYTMALDGTGKKSLIASNPAVDIQSVVQLAPGGPVVGYRFTDDRTRSIYMDSSTKALDQALNKAVPDLPLMNFIATSRDQGKLLLHAASDVDPGVYFLLDRKTSQMAPVLNSNDTIDAKDLAPMKSVVIPTDDGKTIPAYLTMRSDLGAGPHPTVVMPHGGASDRDEWGYDWLGQFLAARGYVVIQPNYRGSSGYGQDFLGENAFHEWRRVMTDIRDAADWANKQGIADPKRMAMVGWSYGGYAALQSAAMDQRYKAVVAIAPVTDLKQLRRDAAGYRTEKVHQDEIGKGDQLSDGSPIRHAAEIHAPVLLVHGTLDGNVDYNHSKRMLSALKREGGTAELLTFEGLDHQLADSDARKSMLTKIGALLDRTIGH